MENQFHPVCYTIAQVTGDAQDRQSAGGKTYRVVPVELLGGKKIDALCRGTPEVMSHVMVRVQHRDSGFGYSLYEPSLSCVQMVSDACTDWLDLLEQ